MVERLRLTNCEGIRQKLSVLLIGLFAVAPGFQASELKTADDPDLERVLAIAADAAYGEYLAGECQTCHQASVGSDSVPVIAGQPVDYIASALLAFKRGERVNQVMQSVAQNMGDEEMAALALYLSNQP